MKIPRTDLIPKFETLKNEYYSLPRGSVLHVVVAHNGGFLKGILLEVHSDSYVVEPDAEGAFSLPSQRVEKKDITGIMWNAQKAAQLNMVLAAA